MLSWSHPYVSNFSKHKDLFFYKSNILREYLIAFGITFGLSMQLLRQKYPDLQNILMKSTFSISRCPHWTTMSTNEKHGFTTGTQKYPSCPEAVYVVRLVSRVHLPADPLHQPRHCDVFYKPWGKREHLGAKLEMIRQTERFWAQKVSVPPSGSYLESITRQCPGRLATHTC